ncbi:MAG: substrate-binding domain-containing protein [Clostridiales bacterium]|nr:substrate-binding domain-containing protein [Clostridiales bacterium]
MPKPAYPVIDGSSSTEIMHAAIRAALLDEYIVTYHSQTYKAIERLVPGSPDPADMILAVKYYDETIQDIKSRGVDLVITPIAKEGFVFLVHPDNPIDSLTQQQIRDIYSVKITNWKEVGGKDEAILLFTRNWDSGSQTAMEDFMDGMDMTAGDQFPIGTMGGMIDAVAKSGSAAIGYNIYSWAIGYWIDGGELKLLAVDGVSPSSASFADDSYPLRIYTYSYYNKGNREAENLTAWLLTDEGQKAIASAGFAGLFGEPSTEGYIDYNADHYESERAAMNYIDSIGARIGHDQHKTALRSHLMRIDDRAQAKALSNGKEKAVTVLYLLQYDGIFNEQEGDVVYAKYHFIVLTREKGGAFAVINSGQALSFEDGVIVPGEWDDLRW